MLKSRKTYTISNGTSPYTIDLSTMADGEKGYVEYICDLTLEFEGNDASATFKGKGSFPNSTFKDVSGGTVAEDGGFFSITGFPLAAIEITTTATLPFSVNVTRHIADI